MTDYEFAQAAHPHSWLLVADNLYEQSKGLLRQFPTGKTMQLDGNDTLLCEWPSSSRSTFLL
ncbi:hypothetical protein JTL70_35080, partial [Pseudomonas aeruginosa]|nr:hypothetical protein [Pseudomonas aeruginosa]